MALTLVTSDLIGGLDYSKLTGTVPTWNQNTTGSAATLTTARTIGGVSFDGSAAINLPGVNAAGDQNTTGNAATATKFASAVNIGGVAFDGSSNINLPGVNAAGNQNTSGTAAGLSATLAVGSGGTGVTSITALKNVLDDETWTFANNITATGTLTVNGTGNSAFNGDLYIVGKKLDISAPSGGNSYVKFSDTNSSAKNWRVGTSLSARGVFNIYNETDDNLAFNILADGKVGIGTTSPAVPLHVNGDTRISGEFSVFPKQIIGSYASSDAGTAAEPSYAFYANTAMGMYPAGTNTLGFSTSGTSCLTISSAGLATFKSTYISASDHGGELTVGGGSTDFGIAMKFNQSGATSGTIYCSPGYTNSSTTLKLGTGANTDQLILNGAGAIGQGVTPLTDPYVSGSEQWMTYQIGKGGIFAAYKNNNESMFGFNTYTKVTDGAHKAIISDIGGSATRYYADRITFNTLTTSGTAQTQTEAMRISSGGLVKVNGATSTSQFNILTSIANSILELKSTSTDPYGIYVKYTQTMSADSNFFFRGDGSTGIRVIIQSNGDLENTHNSYGAISDIKLKENIIDATPKLNDLLKVKIRNYNLIESDKKQIGVIAQELEEIFPSMVSESPDIEDREITDKEGNVTTEKVDLGTVTKSVKYSVFTPMLIKALQEQQAQIELLKQEVESLKQ